jgi:hypothetical protein
MSNDRGGADTMIVVSLPGHGKLFGDNGEQLAVGSTFTTWSYTANNDNADEDWHGAETWEYKLRESCEDDTTQESNSATVTINVPEVDMVIYHGQGGAAVDKTKERVTDQLDANGNPVLDANGNRIKVGEGAFTVANMNDTDNDTFADYTSDDHEANGGHAAANGRNEVDLIKVVLKKPSIYHAGDTMTFSVTFGNGTSDSSKIWKDEFRDEEANVSESFSFGATETEKVYWVELISPSVEIGDYHLSYGYMEGGFTDYASATAVWATATLINDDNATAAQVLAANPRIEQDPAHQSTEDALKLWGGTGLIPSSFKGSPLREFFANGILMQFKVTPVGIWNYDHIVKFDITRRIADKDWVKTPTGALRKVEDVPFPADKESSTEDTDGGNGITDDPDKDGYMYSYDAPAAVFAANYPGTNPVGTWRYYVGNGEEFVRVGIGADPVGVGVVGSRASELLPWHFRHQIHVALNADGIPLLFRTTGDQLETTVNDVAGEVKTLPANPPAP